MMVVDKRNHLKTLAVVGLAAGLLVVAACTSSSEPARPTDLIEDLRQSIRVTVDDPARAELMLEEVDHMVVALEDLGRRVEQHKAKIHELIADYDTSRGELESAMSLFVTERRAAVDRIAESHFALKRLATADEWKKLAKMERAALDWAASRILGESPIVEA